MSFVDPRKPPHLIGDNWRDLARAANVEADTLLPIPEIFEQSQEMLGQPNPYVAPIDPRPDLASELKPGQTFDSEFPYSRDGGITIPGEMTNTFVVVENDPKSSAGIAPVPLDHSPVIPVALRREKTLSDYYGVFGPPKRRS